MPCARWCQWAAAAAPRTRRHSTRTAEVGRPLSIGRTGRRASAAVEAAAVEEAAVGEAAVEEAVGARAARAAQCSVRRRW